MQIYGYLSSDECDYKTSWKSPNKKGRKPKALMLDSDADIAESEGRCPNSEMQCDGSLCREVILLKFVIHPFVTCLDKLWRVNFEGAFYAVLNKIEFPKIDIER